MNFLSGLAPIAHWGVRLSLAATFIYHGLGKWPPTGFAEALGLPLAIAWAVMIAEVLAGLFLMIGAFGKDVLTRLAGLIVIVIMIGAIALVHAANGFSVSNGGFEFQLLMLTVGLYFAARGNNV